MAHAVDHSACPVLCPAGESGERSDSCSSGRRGVEEPLSWVAWRRKATARAPGQACRGWWESHVSLLLPLPFPGSSHASGRGASVAMSAPTRLRQSILLAALCFGALLALGAVPPRPLGELLLPGSTWRRKVFRVLPGSSSSSISSSLGPRGRRKLGSSEASSLAAPSVSTLV